MFDGHGLELSIYSKSLETLMTKEPKKPPTVEEAIEGYLTENPGIREALEVFNLSRETYVSILRATAPAVTTTNSANPR